MADPTVVEVLRVEEPAAGEGRRRVIVGWSDGSTGCALSYFADLCRCPHKSAYADAACYAEPRLRSSMR